jgi:lipopolysaccharide export system permease protein
MLAMRSLSASRAAWQQREARAMLTGTLSRYFGLRFLGAILAVFAGIFGLIALIDYIELMRRHSDVINVSALHILKTSFYRVPQVAERIMPFCVLIGAMSCYLGLSRRLELVIARAAGISAWQFITPALVVAFLFGAFATMVYNPIAAVMYERSKNLEAEISGDRPSGLQATTGGFWLRQQSPDGSHSIINAVTSRSQGVLLDTVTAFVFDQAGKFSERIEAKTAVLEKSHWRLDDAHVYSANTPPSDRDTYLLNTNVTAEQVRDSFSTPETVPFWQLPHYIQIAERGGAAAGYQLQYQKLLARPFMLAAMVILAAAFSLRFFRFGGIQKMVLGGVTAGFLLYMISKITDDLSKAELMAPSAAAWLPVVFGGLTGFVALLYLEDG